MKTSLNLASKSKGVVVDIGCGYGEFVYELAKQNPQKFIIGIEPSVKSLDKMSSKIYKKKPKGGVENVLFVNASVENLPDELKRVANQVFINFPWGSLLAGIVKVDKKIWRNIKKICKKGAIVSIIFGYDDRKDRTEIERLDIPESLSTSYIQNRISPDLKLLGFETSKLCELDVEILKNYPTKWAKKLNYSSGDRKYYYLELKNK